jgi:hypothetical protein
MEFIVKKLIGKTSYTFVFTGANLHEVVMESQKLSFPDVPECGLCRSDDLYLSAHVAQGKFKYTEIRCNKCRAELTLGSRQDSPDTMYLRKDDNGNPLWKAFDPKNNDDDNTDGYFNDTNANDSNTRNTKPAVKQPAPQAPVTNQAAAGKTGSNNVKSRYSGKTLNYATKIAAADTLEKLKAVCGALAKMNDFNDDEKKYLNSECLRKKTLLTAPAQPQQYAS